MAKVRLSDGTVGTCGKEITQTQSTEATKHNRRTQSHRRIEHHPVHQRRTDDGQNERRTVCTSCAGVGGGRWVGVDATTTNNNHNTIVPTLRSMFLD